MKILFIYARFGGGDPYYVDLNCRVPLGLAYLGSVVKKEGFDIQLRDGLFYKSYGEFERELKEINPDVFGVSFSTALMEHAKNYIDIARQILPNVKIIAGGAHPTISSFDVMKEMDVDYIVYGEGEKTLPKLLYFINGDGGNLSAINGLVYRDDGGVKINPPAEFVENLDDIPWPARDLLPMEKYLGIAPLMPLPYPNTNIVVSRGCPGNCLFCQPTLRKLSGGKVRYRSVSDVIKEIKFLVKEYRVKSVDLGVDEPTHDKKWMGEFCDRLIEEKLNIKWGTPSRVDAVNKLLLEKMAKSGCVYISYGIESGSQKIMNILRKGTTVKQAEDALRWTEEVGICGRANIMVGSPGETKDTINESIDFIKRAKPDFIFVAATTPLRGTALYDLAEREDMLVEVKGGVTGYDFGHLKLKDISNEELKAALYDIIKVYKKNLFSFIMNPRMLIRKRHIYIKAFFYFWSLLRNGREFRRIFRYYLRYGEQIKVKGDKK